MRRSRLFLAAILGALVGGCEDGMFCTQCGETKSCKQCPPPKPKKIDWTGLSDELQKVEWDGDVTINVEAGQLVLKPGEDAWKVKIDNWDGLTGQLQEVLKVNAAQTHHYALLQQLHAMLTERQPPATYNYWIWGPPASSIPPPVKLCPRPEDQELRIFAFFPQEARLADWRKNGYENAKCEPESPSPVCPEFGLFEDPVEGLIRALANCPGEQPSLRVRGFASSSGIETLTDNELQEEFDKRHVTESCEKTEADLDGITLPKESEDTTMFNLLVAELRARKVADILKKAAKDEKVTIKADPVVWCSHKDMASERKVKDFDDGGGYKSLEGVLNRRVEIRVVAP